MAVKFLSEEWVAAVKDGLNSSEEFGKAAEGQRARIQQIVTTPEGDLSYWIDMDGAVVDAGMGSIDGASITVSSDYESAVALAKGDLSAMAAFMSGKVRVSNVMSAMGLREVLKEFGDVTRSIDTTF